MGQDPCYNMDFEDGFNGWQGEVGCHPNAQVPCKGPPPDYKSLTLGEWVPGIYNYRQTLMPDTNKLITTGAPYWPADGTDPCASFPTVYPDGGSHSVRLGSKSTGAQSERLFRSFTVTPANAFFGYHYAIVIEQPYGHDSTEAPFFEAMALNASGDTIPCSYYYVNGSEPDENFKVCPNYYNIPTGKYDEIYYKDWTTKYIDLTPYMGQTVTIMFTTSDCRYVVHYTYAYLECFCATASTNDTVVVCQGQSAQLDGPAGALDYSWTGPGGFTGTGQTISVNQPGTYVLHMTGGIAQDCSPDIEYVVITTSGPVADFVMGGKPCSSTIDFKDNSGLAANSWSWDFGDGATSTNKDPSHTYTTEGVYDIRLIINQASGCGDTIIKQVNIGSPPVAAFSSIPVCLGQTTNFTDSSYTSSGAITAWNWDFGDGNKSSQKSPSHQYLTAGSFTVQLIVATGNCTDTITKTVLVMPMPTADFEVSPETASVVTPIFTFTDHSSGGTTGKWTFGDNTDTMYFPGKNPVHEYKNENNGKFQYSVALEIENALGCKSIARKIVYLEPYWSFYIPDAFSPNEDDHNNFFYGKGEGILEYEMWVFDRWGNTVFYCNIEGLPQEMPCWWDGKKKNGSSNETVQQDVYIWIVELKDVFNKKHKYLGHVTLVK